MESDIKQKLDALCDSYELEIMQLRSAINRATTRHSPMQHIYGKLACKECGQEYPCNTIRDLDELSV